MRPLPYLAAFALLVFFPACGTSTPETCSARTCNGCCDSSNVCQSGLDATSCGSFGNACIVCGFVQVCRSNMCVNVTQGGGNGGGTSTGGGTATGGGQATGGGNATGGGEATGGGTPATGGGLATGGGTATGGGVATGGGIATGGGSATGGGTATGGGVATGGGGGTLPSFTSQLWYYGRITSTTRSEVGRVFFPGKQQLAFTVPGTDIRSFAVSPNGRKVALSADATVSGRFDLVLINSDGTGLTSVTPPTGSGVSFVRFSPDGATVMYETKDTTTFAQRLFVMPAAGGTAREISITATTTAGLVSTTFSRDSRYLALVIQRSTAFANELDVYDLTTSTKTTLIDATAVGTPPGSGQWGVVSNVQWSNPTRNEMVFEMRTASNTVFRLMRIKPDGTALAQVPGTTTNVGSFGIAPDGDRVAFSTDQAVPTAYEILVTRLSTGTTAMVTNGTIPAGRRPDFFRDLYWNPASTWLSFGANYDSGINQFEPYLAPLTGASNVFRIAALATGGNIDDVVWSPSGDLALVTDYRTDGVFEIAQVSPVGAGAQLINLVAPITGGRVFDAKWTP